MHQPTPIAISLSLPASVGQELLHTAYTYCLSIYSYYSYYYRRMRYALFGNHSYYDL